MFKKLKLKLAAMKLQIATAKAERAAKRAVRRAESEQKNGGKKSAVRRVFISIIKSPAVFWKWLCTRNTIGLINLSLSSAIIVLFSILIMNIYDLRETSVGKNGSALFRGASADEMPKIANSEQRNLVVRTSVSVGDELSTQTISLPLQKNVRYSVGTRSAKLSESIPVRKLSGDIIIDGEDISSIKLMPGDEISGNLIIQNLRKFNLPCNIKINGNLILRHVGLVRFCGAFTITENIYVSRDSSFGPIPGNARLGGQVLF